MENIIVNNFHHYSFNANELNIITVYYDPVDFPKKYVARVFNSHQPTSICMVKDTLFQIEKGLPDHLMKLDRQEEDDPKIICCYI